MISSRAAGRTALRAASRASIAPRVARTYAAAADTSSKPPVPLYGVDGTYANALVRQISLLGFLQHTPPVDDVVEPLIPVSARLVGKASELIKPSRTTVHRRRQVIRSRQYRQGSRQPRQCLQEGREAPNRAARTHPFCRG